MVGLEDKDKCVLVEQEREQQIDDVQGKEKPGNVNLLFMLGEGNCDLRAEDLPESRLDEGAESRHQCHDEEVV